MREADMINRPPHYQGDGMEAIDVIEAWGLGFHLGNAMKYILRAGRKGPAIDDLRKALWYLNRPAARLDYRTKPRGTLDSEAVVAAFQLPVAFADVVKNIQKWADHGYHIHLTFADATLREEIARLEGAS